MEFSGVAVGRDRVRIETVLGPHQFRCQTCGNRVFFLDQNSQCSPCHLKFATADRVTQANNLVG